MPIDDDRRPGIYKNTGGADGGGPAPCSDVIVRIRNGIKICVVSVAVNAMLPVVVIGEVTMCVASLICSSVVIVVGVVLDSTMSVVISVVVIMLYLYYGSVVIDSTMLLTVISWYQRVRCYSVQYCY